MQIDFQINGAEKLSRNLMTLANNLTNMKSFFSDAIDIVENYSKEAFRAEGKPTPWKPLAKSTKKARERRWGYYKQPPSGTPKILHWTGNLENNNRKSSTGTYGKFEKKAKYAKYHQTGGRNLPQRKVLTLDPKASAEITRRLQLQIEKELGNFGLQY